MKILIVEDEPIAVTKLKRLLAQIDPFIECLDVIGSVEMSVNWLLRNPKPDIIFMDVQLEDGICFEILENVDLKTPVIFTTAYDHYAIEAFRLNSIDYLLKPLKLGDLKRAITKYREIHYSDHDVSLKELIKSIPPQSKERFLVKIGEHYTSIQTRNIDYFFIRNRCNFIHSDGGKNYPVDYSLDKIEEMVDSHRFFRINRKMLVSYAAIQDIISYSTHRLKLVLEGVSDLDDVLVSRERVPDFKRWMDR